MPSVTHRAAVPAALDCVIMGADCASAKRGRGGWWTVKEGREVLCWREASLIDKEALAGWTEAAEEGGKKASPGGMDGRFCRSAGSELEASNGGGGGNETLGGGWKTDCTGALLRCWADLVSLDVTKLEEGGGKDEDEVLATACRGFKLSTVLLETALLLKLAPNWWGEEAEGTAWLKIPANRREKLSFNRWALYSLKWQEKQNQKEK